MQQPAARPTRLSLGLEPVRTAERCLTVFEPGDHTVRVVDHPGSCHHVIVHEPHHRVHLIRRARKAVQRKPNDQVVCLGALLRRQRALNREVAREGERTCLQDVGGQCVPDLERLEVTVERCTIPGRIHLDHVAARALSHFVRVPVDHHVVHVQVLRADLRLAQLADQQRRLHRSDEVRDRPVTGDLLLTEEAVVELVLFEARHH